MKLQAVPKRPAVQATAHPNLQLVKPMLPTPGSASAVPSSPWRRFIDAYLLNGVATAAALMVLLLIAAALAVVAALGVQAAPHVDPGTVQQMDRSERVVEPSGHGGAL